MESPYDKPPSNTVDWEPEVEAKIAGLQQAIEQHQPRLLLSFGAFAFEFARRSLAQRPSRRYSDWGARQLGEEFRKRIQTFDPTSTNLLPLLHISISRGRFIQAHEQYCGQQGANYFDFVATRIADKLLEHRDTLHVWIE